MNTSLVFMFSTASTTVLHLLIDVFSTQVGDGGRDGARSKTPPSTPSKAAAKGKLLGVKVLAYNNCLSKKILLILKVLIY